MLRHLLDKKFRRGSEFSTILDALLGGSQFGSSSISGRFTGRDYYRNCHSMVEEDIALVSVKMASSLYTLSTRSVRVTLADKIAIFGGTMGLFAGTSFIGLIEIVFWLSKLSMELICKLAVRHR